MPRIFERNPLQVKGSRQIDPLQVRRRDPFQNFNDARTAQRRIVRPDSGGQQQFERATTGGQSRKHESNVFLAPEVFQVDGGRPAAASSQSRLMTDRISLI